MRSGTRARQKVPYFGICLGMQTACIEFARNVCGLEDANSSEFDPATPHRVIYKLRELRGVEELGGTMRLGAWACKLETGSLAAQGLRADRDQRTPSSSLRVQPRIREQLTAAGLRITGTTPDGTYVEIVELAAIIHTSWAASSIPNSSRSHSSRILCSKRSLARLTRTAGAEDAAGSRKKKLY